MLEGMDELRALAQVNPEIRASTKNIGMKISCLVVSFPWREDAYAKLQTFGDGREELMTDVRGTSCLSSNSVKLVTEIAKEMWEKESKNGLCLFS